MKPTREAPLPLQAALEESQHTVWLRIMRNIARARLREKEKRAEIAAIQPTGFIILPAEED